ncbi:MAG TPA: MerR family transcriptional regulator [Chroococcidiopsis sp.]
MEPELTIQAVAALTRLSAHTLRYYERIGLIDPVERASNQHRRYTQRDVEWLEFLQRLRATGMPIRQMVQYAALRRQGDRTLAERRSLLESHRQRIRQQINDLDQHLQLIQHKIQHYQQLEDQYCDHATFPNANPPNANPGEP